MIFKKPPETTFTDSIHSTKSLRQLIEATPCPACKQTTVHLATYTVSSKEWGAAVACSNCNFSGEVNSTGFTFNKVNSKGKAKE